MWSFARRASLATLASAAAPYLLLGACSSREHGSSPDAGASASAQAPAALASASGSSSPASPGSAPASASGSAPGAPSGPASAQAAVPAVEARTDGCPEGMVRVEGDYCPTVDQRCLKHHPEWEKDHAVSERCLAFEAPTRCLAKERVKLSFCMDRYEYPNQVGEKPWVLVSWRQAVKLCEKQGKRLCTEDEFNFACEGPDMLPHVYGFERNAETCNIDKPYRKREKKLRTYESCLKNPGCKAELERLDQREPIGQRTSCVSWSGIYDLNGNVNEWVDLPKEKPPNRSGLKGGWWGPVRNRCRPTVTFHKEEDYGYEAGFRCCADAR